MDSQERRDLINRIGAEEAILKELKELRYQDIKHLAKKGISIAAIADIYGMTAYNVYQTLYAAVKEEELTLTEPLTQFFIKNTKEY